MTVNTKISKQDYNNIQALIADTLGTGTGTFGYGQPLRSSQVSESNKITVTDWANLRDDILNCYLHTTNSTPSSPQAVVNTIVRSNPTDSPYTRYQTLANPFADIAERMVQPPAGRVVVDNYPTSSTTWPGPFGDYWRTQTESIIRLSWSSSDQARHFFNSGGRIRVQTRRTGGETSTQNSEWTNLLNSASVQEFGGNFPQTGTGETQTLNGGNFYRLDAQFRTFYTLSKTGTYSANTYQLQARAVNATGNDNSTGTASIIEIRAVWSDNFNSTTPGSPDRVNGTMEVLVSNTRATGPLVPSGTFTIESPTVAITPPRPVGVIANSTYSVEPRSTSINEGGSLTFDIATDNVPSGTTLYWSIFGGPNVTSADFSSMSGSFSINSSGNGTVTVSAVADRITEGTEFFYLEIRTTSTSGPIIATSRSVNINDTSFVFYVNYNARTASTSNLRNIAISRGWDQIQRLEFQINSTSRLIGSANGIAQYNRLDSPTQHRDVAGLVVNGSYPNGLIIRNDGSLNGRGGSGGLGGVGSSGSGSPGGPGGPGLVFTSSVNATFITLVNNGYIGGGGGGGGGGAGFGSSRGGGGGGGAPLGTGNQTGGGNADELRRGIGGVVGDGGFSNGGDGGNLGFTGTVGKNARPNGTGTGGSGGLGGHGIVGASAITTSIGTGVLRGGTVSSTAQD